MADSHTVKCAPDGPYLIQGPAVIVDPTGQQLQIATGKNAALCRCGASGNKPFCDGTHTKTGFRASEAGQAS